MKNPVAGMPWPLRAAFGVFVSGVFAFIGASFWESSRVLACVLLGLAAMRLWAVVRLVAWHLGDHEEEPPEISEETRALAREMDATLDE